MTDYLSPSLDVSSINQISALGLAHIGDAVYETCVRSYLCLGGHKAVQDLHVKTVSMVNAQYQAKAVEKILAVLSPDELAVYKRGRNARVNSVPHNASISEYHAATGLETLFGWLFLKGERERINLLFSLMMEDNDGA